MDRGLIHIRYPARSPVRTNEKLAKIAGRESWRHIRLLYCSMHGEHAWAIDYAWMNSCSPWRGLGPYIISTFYYHLRSSAGKISLLYGLPKIHKPTVPLRPIQCPLWTLQHTSSRNIWLASCHPSLETHTPSYIKNSLFTNVPVDLPVWLTAGDCTGLSPAPP